MSSLLDRTPRVRTTRAGKTERDRVHGALRVSVPRKPGTLQSRSTASAIRMTRSSVTSWVADATARAGVSLRRKTAPAADTAAVCGTKWPVPAWRRPTASGLTTSGTTRVGMAANGLLTGRMRAGTRFM